MANLNDFKPWLFLIHPLFCAFADTAAYLYDNLRDWARDSLNVHIALVSGGAKANQTTFGKADFTEILVNFSPRAKQRDKIRSMPQDDEIDILIATDCISEGQNLQDCDLLVNYDIHWNPVRIIQRFAAQSVPPSAEPSRRHTY